MNTFERELRKMLEGIPIHDNAVWIGRTFYSKVGGEFILKIEFSCQITGEHYDALRLTLFNQTHIIDTVELRFEDICEKADSIPYLWNGCNGISWNRYHPTEADYAEIGQTILKYVGLFQ